MDSGGSIRLAVAGRRNDNASIVTAEEWFPHYLHFYWCSKLQIAFPSFCLCLCVEGSKKKKKKKENPTHLFKQTLYKSLQRSEVNSSLNKTSGCNAGNASILLFEICCILAEVELILRDQTALTAIALAAQISVDSLSSTCNVYRVK